MQREEIRHYFESWTSKSKTKSLVSSVPFLEPTAHTSFVELARILQTTPPDPPLSKATRSRINSPEKRKIRENGFFFREINDLVLPFLTSQSLTVPSSEDVITNFELN